MPPGKNPIAINNNNNYYYYHHYYLTTLCEIYEFKRLNGSSGDAKDMLIWKEALLF